MIDEQLKTELLDSITKYGKAKKPEIKINPNINYILDFSSGTARIQSTCIRKAKLIISQPFPSHLVNPFEVRCCLCGKVISYPCWYYEVRYAVNVFHYFVCFHGDNPSKPSTRCYRKV